MTSTEEKSLKRRSKSSKTPTFASKVISPVKIIEVQEEIRNFKQALENHDKFYRKISDDTSESVLMYRCPEINEDVLPKETWYDRIREYVELIAETDEVLAAIIAIKSLNPEETSEKCLKVLEKCLTTLILDPFSEKYSRIKFDNRTLQKYVLAVEGGGRFLTAVGFEVMPMKEDGLEYFVYTSLPDDEALSDIVELMKRAVGFRLISEKDEKANQSQNEGIHAEGFNGEEANKQQECKSKTSGKGPSLKAKIKKPPPPEPKYTRIKIRLPDGTNFEGTFMVDETLSQVRTFIEDKFDKGLGRKYKLFKPPAEFFAPEDYEKTLEQLELFPRALLNLRWEEPEPKQKQNNLNRTPKGLKRTVKVKL